jgi:hypothetical protein
MVEAVERKKLPDTIVYGKGAIAHKTEQARVKIWSSPRRYEWVQYLDGVRVCYQVAGCWAQTPYRYYLHSISPLAHRWLKSHSPDVPKQRFDWLVYGGAERGTEIAMMKRLVNALLKRGERVGYLVAFGSREHQEIVPLAEGSEGRLTLIDLYEGLHGKRRYLSASAAPQAWRDFCDINDLLGAELTIPARTFSLFLGGMAKRLLWERLRPLLDYDRLIVRNHFGSLDSVIALDGLLQGKQVITLQHGVISSSGFFPVLADTVITFGEASANFLKQADAHFAQMTGSLPFARRYVPAGSLFDEIADVGDTFAHRTLLVIDQDNVGARRFYGLHGAIEALHQVVRDCATQLKGIHIVYRLHPSARKPPEWVQSIQRKGGDVEVSQGVPLLQDIARSTVAIGLFSGALTVAAACGVPTVFVWKEGWFYTPDLACFGQCFLSPEEAMDRVWELMTSSTAYAQWQRCAIAGGEGYYSRRQQADLDRVLGSLEKPASVRGGQPRMVGNNPLAAKEAK